MTPVRVKPLPDQVVVDKHVPICVRDGKVLYANVYRPRSPGQYPVILSCSPYGKDDTRGARHGYTSFRLGALLFGLDFGDIEVSEGTAFEAPSPGLWVPEGYVVIHYDTRGSHRSEGRMDLFSQTDREDYYDVIEWAASQPWSTGNVGCCGVSYLAISQWFVASLRPPHLKAIVAWEGLTDVYRDATFHGGIPETGFTLFYLYYLARFWNYRYLPAHNPIAVFRKHQTHDGFWEERTVDLENISVPSLICASFSDQGLHTRGAFEAFYRVSSKEKYLFNHGRRKWETFYSPEAVDAQKRFLGRFLKNEAGPNTVLPRVRLEVRIRGEAHLVCHVEDFPVPGTEFKRLYLDASRASLDVERPDKQGVVRYRARRGRVRFQHRFARETVLAGPMALRLWVACPDHDDLDLFVGIKKLDPSGKEIHFPGFSGNDKDIVAKGWLRVSHRELDETRSQPWKPYLKHESVKKVPLGEVVPVDIEILPSGTLFEKDASMILVVQGRDVTWHPFENHRITVNRGVHELYTGGDRESYLLIPDATSVLLAG